MTVTEQSTGRWSHHRWRRTLVGVFLLQFLFLWYFSAPLPEPKKAPSNLGNLRFAPELAIQNPMHDILTLMDPTLFAFASTHGFSGPAWYNSRLPDHQLKERIFPAQPLASDPAFFGKIEAFSSKTDFLASLQTSEKSDPRLMEVNVPQPPLCPQSYYKMEEPLNQRLIPINDTLQAWTNKDLLSNSIVQIVVDASGRVFSTRLGGGCGLAEADNLALNHAKGLQFRPLNAGADATAAGLPNRLPFAWGKLVYHWATVPSVVITNLKAAP